MPPLLLPALAAAAIALAGISGHAALSPPDRWLPSNTVALVTIPDATAARAQWNIQAPARLWNDPSMRPFRSHLYATARTHLLDPLTQLTGLDLEALPALAHGQITLALLNEAPAPSSALAPAQLLVLDAGPNHPALRRWLARAAAHPAASPGPRLNGTTSLTLTLPAPLLDAALAPIFQNPATSPPSPPRPPIRLHLAERDAILVASTSTQALAQVLSSLDILPASPAIAARLPASDSGAIVAGWTDPRPWLGSIEWHLPDPLAFLAALSGTNSIASRLVHALGLNALRAAMFSVRTAPEGWYLDLELVVPPNARRGIFKLLEVRPAEAGPPPFLGTNTVAVHRVRLPGPTAWSHLERIARDLGPALAGALGLFTESLAPAEDPAFDFQRSILNQLGDDWIVATVQPPSNDPLAKLLFVSSPQAPRLAASLAAIASPDVLATFLPPRSPPPTRTQTRIAETLVTSLAFPPMARGSEASTRLHFAARDGHIAFAIDRWAIEHLVASTDPIQLAHQPYLLEAVRCVGGTDGGYFSLANEPATAAKTFEKLRRHPEALLDRARWLSFLPSAQHAFAGVVRWMDFAQLPAFEQVEPFLGLRVTRGQTTTNGFRLTTFRPMRQRPPGDPITAPLNQPANK